MLFVFLFFLGKVLYSTGTDHRLVTDPAVLVTGGGVWVLLGSCQPLALSKGWFQCLCCISQDHAVLVSQWTHLH